MIEFFKKYSKWVIIFILGSALIAVYKTFNSFDFIKSVFSVVLNAIKPFIIAFIIAYLLNIPVKHLDRFIKEKIKPDFFKRHSYSISIATVYILFLVILVVVLCLVLPALLKSLIDMAQNLPQYLEQFISYINNLDIMKGMGVELNVTGINDAFRGWIRTIDASVMGRYAQGFLSITSGIVSVASTAMSVFIAFIASIYMLIDKDRIIRSIRRGVSLFSKGDKLGSALRRLSSINEVFTQYIYSRLMCSVVMAAICSLILTLMGEKYGLLLGIFIGIMDIIPYFGSIISWVVGAVIMAISGGIMHSVWCSVLMLVMQQIDGNILAPKIMGSRLEIRPLAVIAAVSIGGTLFGFIGLILSVPVFAILRAVVIEFVQSKEKANRIDKAENNEDDTE